MYIRASEVAMRRVKPVAPMKLSWIIFTLAPEGAASFQPNSWSINNLSNCKLANQSSVIFTLFHKTSIIEHATVFFTVHGHLTFFLSIRFGKSVFKCSSVTLVVFCLGHALEALEYVPSVTFSWPFVLVDLAALRFTCLHVLSKLHTDTLVNLNSLQNNLCV